MPQMFDLETSLVKISPHRQRKDFRRGLSELQSSIDRHGLIHPIVVSPDPDDPQKFLLVAGERRFHSVIRLGWTQIPATLRDDLDEIELQEIELEENLRREDLEWTEKIEAQMRIHELKESRALEKGEEWSMEKTAEETGQSATTVKRQIKLARDLKKRPDIAEKVKHLPAGVARQKYTQLLEGERLQRLVKSGRIAPSANLLLGDCIKLIAEIPDNSIDLVITDPPYGISRIEGPTGGASYSHEMVDTDNLDIAAVTMLFENLVPQLRRVCRVGAHFYIFFGFEMYEMLLQIFKREGFLSDSKPLIWLKNQPTAPFKGYEYAPIYEPILFGHVAEKTRTLARSASQILQYPIQRHELKHHPLHKPTEILSFLIEQSSHSGETVLDPFAGSGSVLRAATALGRRSVGFEINPEHFARAQVFLQEQKNDSK